MLQTRLPNWARASAPPTTDLLDAARLAEVTQYFDRTVPSLLAGGDVMLGDRALGPMRVHGSQYPFEHVRPLLEASDTVLVNHEGPFGTRELQNVRRFSYRVDPAMAHVMAEAGITVVTLANNHLLDCGPEGVLESLEAVESAGIASVGAGRNLEDARKPGIIQTGGLRIGFLGYYWNKRCSATESTPGAPPGTLEQIEEDVSALRKSVDRVVVTLHWGVPYDRHPLPDDREKAHVAIDCGADAVVGHHPHVIQPVEVYKGRPIIYSLGNFVFGSGHSQAGGMLARFEFHETGTTTRLFPLYVRNRDPRINYRPMVMGGHSATRVLSHARDESWLDDGGASFDIADGVGILVTEY